MRSGKIRPARVEARLSDLDVTSDLIEKASTDSANIATRYPLASEIGSPTFLYTVTSPTGSAQPETKDFAYGETWKSVRFASTNGLSWGASRFQNPTEPFVAVIPSKVVSGVPTRWQLTTRVPSSPSE